jgi:hypothetical protein
MIASNPKRMNRTLIPSTPSCAIPPWAGRLVERAYEARFPERFGSTWRTINFWSCCSAPNVLLLTCIDTKLSFDRLWREEGLNCSPKLGFSLSVGADGESTIL